MDEDPQAARPSAQERADAELLAHLRAVAGRLDPVPADAVLAARSMLAHLRLDAALAELTYDSLEDRAPVGVRAGTAGVRLLTFDAGTVQIELEIVAEGERRRLVGQCLPPAEVVLTVHRLEHPGSRSARAVWSETTTDELGRFTVDVPTGPVSLRCVWTRDDRTVETAWVSA